MLLIIGLGNPGESYDRTRHNIGYLAIDRIVEHYGLKLRRGIFKPYIQAVGGLQGGVRFTLVKPLTYMNRSGEILPALIRSYGSTFVLSNHLIVICDTMDLPAGTARIKRGGSTAGHNGIKSIIESLGQSEFIRIYVGIGRPATGVTVVDHVLGRPDEQDMITILEGVDRACDAIIRLLEGHTIEEVMNVCNRRDP